MYVPIEEVKRAWGAEHGQILHRACTVDKSDTEPDKIYTFKFCLSYTTYISQNKLIIYSTFTNVRCKTFFRDFKWSAQLYVTLF